MNEKTLKALKGSCEKWYNILHHDGEDTGSDNCPLCREFIVFKCSGCPVREKTTRGGCRGTPFHEWENHHTEKHHTIYKDERRIRCNTCRELARAEYDFLSDLYIKALESTPAKIDEIPRRCPFCGYEPKLGDNLECYAPSGKNEEYQCPDCGKWYPLAMWELNAKLPHKKPRVEKEEWVDITREIMWTVAKGHAGYYLKGVHDGTWVVQMTPVYGICQNYCDGGSYSYKIELNKKADQFNVFKKRG